MAGALTPSAGFALQRRRHLPWVYALLVILSVALVYVAVHMVDSSGKPASDQKAWEPVRDLLVTGIGGLAALLFFLYQQHREETRLFIELFNSFNARYDRLNARLNRIVARLQADPDAPLLPHESDCLNDYFNLCAEEYLFARSGYLDPEVWRAWRAGMKYYQDVPAIRRRWRSELGQGSYYGFDLTLLDAP